MKDENKGLDIPQTMSDGNGNGDDSDGKKPDVIPPPEPQPSKKTGLLKRGRAKPDQYQNLGVATEFTVIANRKPRPDEFYRVHPSEDFTDQCNIIELKSEGEWWLVDEDVLPAVTLEKTLKLMQIYTCITFSNEAFLCCVPLADPTTGKLNPWHESGHETMQRAKAEWIRRQPASQGYLTTRAVNDKLPDPKWPNMTFDEMIDKAFGRYFIDREDHPVLLRLIGQRISGTS